MTQDSSPEPGWYPDPSGPPGLRWWNGVSWSDTTHAMPGSDAPGGEAGDVENAYPDIFDDGSEAGATESGVIDASSSRRGRGLAIAIGVVLTGVAVITVVALLSAIASRSQLDTAAVEQQIAQELSVQTGQTTTVRCPDSVTLEADATFTCSASTADGRSGQVAVTQDDAEGNVTWRLVD